MHIHTCTLTEEVDVMPGSRRRSREASCLHSGRSLSRFHCRRRGRGGTGADRATPQGGREGGGEGRDEGGGGDAADFDLTGLGADLLL